MEIRIEERLTGRAYKDRLLSEYGSLEALKKAAKTGNTTAKADYADLQLLLEDPKRLRVEFKISTITSIEASDLERLTPERLKLLAKLANLPSPVNVGILTASLGRDKKNVSRDVQILKELGLLDSIRQGRETLVQPMGNEIHISLAA